MHLPCSALEIEYLITADLVFYDSLPRWRRSLKHTQETLQGFHITW